MHLIYGAKYAKRTPKFWKSIKNAFGMQEKNFNERKEIDGKKQEKEKGKVKTNLFGMGLRGKYVLFCLVWFNLREMKGIMWGDFTKLPLI